jgi:predicted PurR-regulated permease PerM
MSRQADPFRRYLILALSGPLLFLNFWLLGRLFEYFEQVITIIVLSAIFALLFSYPVQWLESRRVRRLSAIFIVLAIALTAVILLGFTVIPLVVEQANQLLDTLPRLLEEATQRLSWVERFVQRYRPEADLQKLAQQLETWAETVLSWLPGLAIGTLGRLLDATFVLVLSIYMLLYGQQMWVGLIGLLPPQLGKAFGRSLQFNFRQFCISQVLLALVMFAGLVPIFLVLRVKYALLFALLVGLFQIIPLVGAAIGIFLVSVLSLFQGFWIAVWVGGTSIVLQQIKDNLIAPKLMGEFIGMNPIWIFISLLLGARIAGILGVLLAIPIAGTIKSTVEQLRELQEEDSNKLLLEEDYRGRV